MPKTIGSYQRKKIHEAFTPGFPISFTGKALEEVQVLPQEACHEPYIKQ